MTDACFMTVCIPAYDMGGHGGRFLSESLDRMVAQTFNDFDVVVSDQSDSSAVADVCAAFADRLRIERVPFADGPRQASANTNNAMRHATGEVVKILFQDDLLAGRDALAQTADAFRSDVMWLLCGSAVTRDGISAERPMVPHLHPQIRFGKNTVSSPSVLAMRRETALAFDETLIWLMDVEMYDRLGHTHGAPAIVPETLILNRLHAGQVSASVTPDLRKAELSYVREKTRARETWADWWAYTKQVVKAR